MLIELRDLVAGYPGKEVLHSISLAIDANEIVAIVGHNGAGKTTLLKAILGVVKVSAGAIVFQDEDVTHHRPNVKVKRGITLCPDAGAVFTELSVLENLLMGVGAGTSNKTLEARLAEVYELFPVLKEREKQMAGLLSGGQQRMVSVGRAIMSRPKLLMLDEPSQGLAPIFVQHMMEVFQQINRSTGTSIILAEQNIGESLGIAHRAYVLKAGTCILEEEASKLLESANLWDLL